MTSKDFTKWLWNAKDLTMEDILFQLSYVSDMDYFPAQNISHLTSFDRSDPEIPMPSPTKMLWEGIHSNKQNKSYPMSSSKTKIV